MAADAVTLSRVLTSRDSNGYASRTANALIMGRAVRVVGGGRRAAEHVRGVIPGPRRGAWGGSYRRSMMSSSMALVLASAAGAADGHEFN